MKIFMVNKILTPLYFKDATVIVARHDIIRHLARSFTQILYSDSIAQNLPWVQITLTISKLAQLAVQLSVLVLVFAPLAQKHWTETGCC